MDPKSSSASSRDGARRSWSLPCPSRARSRTSASPPLSQPYSGGLASCVSRTTRRDDCSLNRFMVWTAIYRNRCQYIPADERRSCPLLLCNQRFPTLELLLQHLYGCPELEAAQYWCYECQRVELFDDAQCAGPSRSCCVGHPSRRRRVLDMAKELFSSIGHHHRRSGGHRPRRTNHAGGGSWGGSGGGVGLDANNNDQDAWVFNTGPNTPFFDFNLDVPTLDVPSFVDSPPSYFDAQSSPARNGGVELQASDNQICELDSAEIPPPAIPEGFPMGAQMGSQMGSMAPPPPSSRPSGHAIEYDSSNFGSTIAPQDLTRFPTQAEAPGCRSTGRPNLQVQTAVAPSSSFRQPQPKSRSRDLAPSSSLRSTNSTNSTNSTFSNTTALSGFSQPRSSGIFTSALTTPTSEYWSDSFLSSTAGKAPHLLLPSQPPHGLEGDASHNIHGQFCDPSTLSAAFPCGDPFFSMGMSELPGTDVNSYLSMPSSAESAPGDARPQPKAEDAPQAESAPLSANDFSSSGRVSASSLIETLIDTLQVHVSETTAHLSSILSSNSTNGRLREMASQLGSMTAEKVAVQGLDIMIALSCGEHPPSSLADPRTGESVRDTSALLPAIGLLCFVHLVFAMSMLIHDSDGSTRAVDLFVQAMDYRFWTSPDDRGAFGVLVCALWKPKHMDRRQAVIFANDPASYHWRIDPSSSSGMGQPRRLPWSPDNDLGLLTARHFLDDVEFATVIKHKNSGHSNGTFDLSTSEIMTKHIIESNLNLTRDSKAKAMIQDLVTGLRATFGPGTELSSKLDRMYADNGIVAKNVFTARKFELELMNAGKTTLPRDILFDKYVPFVRQRMGRLYRDYSSLSALDYHRVDAQAIRDVLDPPEPDMDADMDADIPSMMGGTGDAAHAGGGWSGWTDHSHMDLFAAFGSGDVQTRHAGLSTNPLQFPDSEAASALQARPTDMGNRAPNRNPARHNSTGDESFSTAPTATTTPLSKTAKTAKTPPTGSSGNRGQARRRESVGEEEDEDDDDDDDDEDDEEEEEGQYGDGQHYGQPSGAGLSSTPSDGCFLCDYKPSGDPRWFAGSMSKHMKTKHSGVTKVFKCPHVGCNSKYTNRPDNLRQHQMKKRHFSSAEEEAQIMEAAAARAENRKRRKTK